MDVELSKAFRGYRTVELVQKAINPSMPCKDRDQGQCSHCWCYRYLVIVADGELAAGVQLGRCVGGFVAKTVPVGDPARDC